MQTNSFSERNPSNRPSVKINRHAATEQNEPTRKDLKSALDIKLSALSKAELLSRFNKLVRTERKITHLVLLYIAEIETRKIYADLGFDGMYAYLTRGLGYSEGSAYRRLQSARLLKQVPRVAEMIEAGSLNLSQLTQVQKCLKESAKNGESISVEQTLEVLTKLENKNSFETQKTLAQEMNSPVVLHEKLKPQQDNSVRIEMTLTKEQFAELEQARSFLSHICPEGSWSEVISTLAKQFNHRKLYGRTRPSQENIIKPTNEERPDLPPKANPSQIRKASTLESADSNQFKKENLTQAAIARGKSFKSKNSETCQRYICRRRREYISIHMKRVLFKKAQHCCEYRDPHTQQRCQSKYKLEIDHRQPIALGGNNELGNLRILCQAHNALAARRAGLQ